MLISWATMHWLLTILLLILSVVTALHALTHKRDPRSSLLWIIVCLSIPFAGPVSYLLFGINRAHNKVEQLGAVPETSLSEDPELKPDQQSRDHYSTHRTLGTALTELPLAEGNLVEILVDGEEAYPAMLESIEKARSWIYLSSYIFENKGIGKEFIDALTSAMERGVDVCVLLDGAGAWYSRGKTRRILAAKGIKVVSFLPPAKVFSRLTINLRNHRKILLVDGQQGFTGGMNIRQSHLIKTADPKKATKDTMFRLQGPVLKQIGEVFEEDWFYASGEQLSAKEYEDSQPGLSSCRVISDGPGVHLDILAKILISAISSAQSSIYIVTPYFLPPRELIVAIQSAALRGVEVTILLPANNNLPYVHWAMRNSLWQFLQYGVRIYYQEPPFDHSKLLVIDQHYCQIGSANFDSRSLRLNFELNVEIFDSELGKTLSKKIENDKQNATEITEEQLADRSLPVRIWDAFWWLFTPYL